MSDYISRRIRVFEQLERVQRVNGGRRVRAPVIVKDIIEPGTVFPYEQA